ncbi:MFS transporter [Phenylobacterium sp. SCN 70-31]|uniref:spinster family MFS transporter n=1 Tax=Phenylobacterium sp. SCN 70-31 TaxID=1660129 RepID=UPI00086F45DA|nr:MFS transporter [Phenylobacterium sp. SCN 70-31]ODT85550.1 MAG: MFS transporter [Phenylobacterium sp. SCN 70-31]
MAAADTPSGDEGHIHGYGTRRYRTWVLGVLLFIFILNFVDRTLLSVVAPQMKPELGISDTAFGLLTGFGFALLFTVVGIPLAQLAETRHRVWIMSICLSIWSLMTALCGLAADVTIGSITIGAFWILLACRVGVGVGEAGCVPQSNSIIADYFPPHARSTALGFFGMGVTLGTMLANVVGGPITDAFGWRWAFLILGLPGVLVAVGLKLTVREPPRGYTDPPGTPRREKVRMADGLREIASKRSFYTMTAAATVAAFCGYGLSTFQSLFVSRSFGMTAGEAAIAINVPVALAAAAGTFATGWMAEKLRRRSSTAIAWLPGLGLLICVPFYIVAFSTDHIGVCLAGLVVGGAVKYGYVAAQYTISQGVVSAQTRALATAVMMFVINLIGYGLGPLFIGGLSDVIFAWQVSDMGAASLTRAACEGAARSGLDAAMTQVCAVAHPQSLQRAMLITASIYALSGVLFLLTARTLKSDLVAR